VHWERERERSLRMESFPSRIGTLPGKLALEAWA